VEALFEIFSVRELHYFWYIILFSLNASSQS